MLLTIEEAFAEADIRRLERTVELARSALRAPVASLLPRRASATAAAHLVRDHCVYAHHAVLLFPASVEAAMRWFAERGLPAQPPAPSVVVRRRLSERHAVPHADCPTWVTRLRLAERGGTWPAVEAFLFPAAAPRIARSERDSGCEDHVALQVVEPSAPVVERLMRALREHAGLVWEGGGYTPHDSPGGSTVLYFVRGRTAGEPLRRWELNCAGDLSDVLARHPVDAGAVARAYNRNSELIGPR